MDMSMLSPESATVMWPFPQLWSEIPLLPVSDASWWSDMAVQEPVNTQANRHDRALLRQGWALLTLPASPSMAGQ